MSITSEFNPPFYQIASLNVTPSSLINRLIIKVNIAVFKNYAIPILLATLIL